MTPAQLLALIRGLDLLVKDTAHSAMIETISARERVKESLEMLKAEAAAVEAKRDEGVWR